MADTVRDMVKALEALLAKLDASEKHIVKCIAVSTNHGAPYLGPGYGDEIIAARAALSAHKAAGDGWRPIAEAPKDGRDVLLYKPAAKRPIKVDRWVARDGERGNWWECRPDEMPTRWCPLPSPPAGEKK